MSKQPKTTEVKPAMGRRPVDDKRKSIRIFPQQSRISALGGEDALKLKLMQFIEKQFVKIKK